jgi:hypothetical protein
VTDPGRLPDTDRGLCDRISRADAAAVDELIGRDYGTAGLLASAAATAGADVAENVALAWQQLIADVASHSVTDGLRGAWLERVITVLDDRELLDTGPPAALRRPVFLTSDLSWAGWWADDPAQWPPGVVLTQGQILAGLRRVPVGRRVLLVLRDAARISAQETQAVVGVPLAQQTALLDQTRQDFVAAIDHELTGDQREGENSATAVDAPVSTAGRAGIQASDVTCEVIVGLIGRWLDADLDEGDSDAFEQHLLFCPPCLIQTDKTRLALAALGTAPAAVPGNDLRLRLARLLEPRSLPA